MASSLRAFAILAVLWTNPVLGAEVAGVKIDEKARVADAELSLTGAGLRRRVFFQVYVIGLYVQDRKADPVTQPGPKRVHIHMLRDVGADTFTEALADGIRANHSEAEANALEPRVKQLASIFSELTEARKGSTIALDWTGTATQLVVDGKRVGAAIAGEDFYRALLRIWLGDKPVQDDLKKALSGTGT
jgi:hypothetical protein